MTQREVAAALGISRTLVQAIERRIFIKLGIEQREPRWLQSVGAEKPWKRCSNCRQTGHNAAGCVVGRVKPGRCAKVWP